MRYRVPLLVAGVVCVVTALVAVIIKSGTGAHVTHSTELAPLPTPVASGTREIVHARWSEPISVDGYAVTFTAPVDATSKFPCSACDTGVLLTTVTVTAESAPVTPDQLHVQVVDANFGDVGMTSLGSAQVPVGSTHVERDVQIHVDVSYLHKLIVVTLIGETQTIEWRQESR